MSFAARLKELRLRAGQSLQQVADAVGVSKTHIWELETGRSKNPSMEMLAKLADHFKVTIKSLVGEDLEAAGADEQLMRMFRQASELSPEDRATLDHMIQGFLQRKKERDAQD